MSSSVSTTVGGVMVVTHVHPAPQGAESQRYVGIQKFTKAWPLALGTVQIMIGLMVLLFGIVSAITAHTLGVYSNIFVWGALIYITAGSLTVAAGKSVKLCPVNGALVLCVIAAVASCTATILYSVDAAGILATCYGSYYNSNCYSYQSQTQGFSGVLAVFHFLEFIVSITVSGFACSATCDCNSQPPSFVVVSGDAAVTPYAPLSVQAPVVSVSQLPPQVPSYPKIPEDLRATAPTEPPAYNAFMN
ncbi:membrane-spanning 4-domains subfamily A member 4D-like isoform X5 [Toxotes jaculatrix]|uniref:membrane-spanning 4-domains subfamily A member 4D-like isoform X4 n=1 Tax=Toxotes jaculatrix TaxID=941984 RepID=UPI001B3AB553|nr:membrane-spanning 4-domains subfamily A member 4D-like isoform X4 [Toxotes jaculatrix]XP_040890268.1 membrane-spanning 4-domains subfamily A member 4D-like isoform X5 [Toxotes jaculatrix]